MENNIGGNIKKRRLELGLTQKDLASGICTQAQISNIEKGSLNPSCTVLFEISKKLLVDMNYFFELNPNKPSDHFNEIQNMIKQLKSQRNYTSIKYIVENELEVNRHRFSPYEQRFLLWNRGISVYYLSNNFEESIRLLEELIIESTTFLDILQNINIKTSIAIIHQEEKLFSKAYDLFKEAWEQLLTLENIGDYQTEIKILFGLSQTLSYLEKYYESKVYCLKAISICVKKDTLYLLADSYYQVGYNLIKLNKKEEGLTNIQTALSIYKVQGNNNMINIVNEQLEKLI
ncbi:helix-turn-helix domain-containing protein [Bacillus sp. FJAT-45037]|uniref:helix-turn-helix domain-containing protein n=1 Tax=Bacillus sp. FJAT-45037 TaxID=2011007 RepID=UPI0012FDBAE0|nr:helix-turn-helix domain-containing protein [Bacillus sp. FJAT-45037]